MYDITNEIDLINKILNVLEQNSLSKNQFQGFINSLQAKLRFAKDHFYRLGVVGVTSSGKSTMINSLLGENLLPQKVKPSSSQLVRCHFGKERYANIFFEDKPKVHVRGKALTNDVIGFYGDEECNSKNKEHVKEIEIVSPNFPFSEQLLLVDSPGLDAFGFDEHEKLTMNTLLPTIDFCVFVTICGPTSDDKTLEIINEIADYDKPLVIVQNMIDSLRESVDGKKSDSDVARDYKNRVKAVVSKSNFQNKESIPIVQISAKWALNGREGNDKRILEKSNYQGLVDAITTVFNSVRPQIENNRLLMLKKDIDRIVVDIEQTNSQVKYIVERFEFDNEQSLFNDEISSLKKVIDDAYSKIDNINNRLFDFNRESLDSVKQKIDDAVSPINSKCRDFYKYVKSLCERLNIDIREVLANPKGISTPTIDYKYTTKEKTVYVDKPGWWNSLKRHIDILDLNIGKEKETIEYTIVDEKSTVEDVKEKLKSVKTSINQLRSTWLDKQVDSIKNKIFNEIENKRKDYNNRLQANLDAQLNSRIASELKDISRRIKISNPKTTQSKGFSEAKFEPLYETEVDDMVWNLYRLSDDIRRNIHQEIIRVVSDKQKRHLIIGWNKTCESRFLYDCFKMLLSDNQIVDKSQQTVLGNQNVVLWHNPIFKKSHRNTSSNVYILINAIQIGQAKKELFNLVKSGVLLKEDCIFMVVQDFREIITANAVEETIENFLVLGKEIGLNIEYKIMLNHSNPIYNLAAFEAQSLKGTITEETKVNSMLQRDFDFLICKEEGTLSITNNIIRILNRKRHE